jgi:hypothetical protein
MCFKRNTDKKTLTMFDFYDKSSYYLDGAGRADHYEDDIWMRNSIKEPETLTKEGGDATTQ